MREIMKNRTDIKSLMVGIVALTVVGMLATFYPTWNADAGDKGKGNEVSSQATTGDVPPIVMMPHKSKNELQGKLEKNFKIDSMRPVELHPNKTFKTASITVKNRSKASKKRERRELKDFHNDEFYMSEGKKFLSRYSGMLGVKNLEKNMQLRDIVRRMNIGNSSLSLSLSLSGYLIENAYVSIAFGSDDTIIGATIKLPQITPEMYRVVKAGKDKIPPLKDILELSAVNFEKKCGSEGVVSCEHGIWYRGDEDVMPKVYVTDKAPYLVTDLVWSPVRGAMAYRVKTSVFTGEVVDVRIAGKYMSEDEGPGN